MTIVHPYYVAESRRLLKELAVSPDADPLPLAEWAQIAPSDHLVFITRDGRIVARGHYTPGVLDAAYMNWDEDTLPGAGLQASIAARMLTEHLGQPVIMVKRDQLGVHYD